MHSPLKWAGGKRKVMPYLIPHLPATCRRYVEPFLGSATVFLGVKDHTRWEEYPILADLNEDLILTFQAIRDNFSEVKRVYEANAEKFQNDAESFRKVRTWAPYDRYERAARMLYLNRTAFNGLYRVNRSGQFNVPFGNYKNLNIPWGEWEKVSRSLGDTALVHGTWRRVLSEDYLRGWNRVLIYLDPPYDPLTLTSNFASYQAEGFGPQDQEDLAFAATQRVKMGAYVVASNHDTPRIRKLWGEEATGGLFDIFPLTVKRSISGKAESRKAVPEVLIVSKNLSLQNFGSSLK